MACVHLLHFGWNFTPQFQYLTSSSFNHLKTNVIKFEIHFNDDKTCLPV